MNNVRLILLGALFFIDVDCLHAAAHQVVDAVNKMPVAQESQVKPYQLDPILVHVANKEKYGTYYNPAKMIPDTSIFTYIKPLKDQYKNIPEEALPSFAINVVEKISGNPAWFKKAFGFTGIYTPQDVTRYLQSDLIFLNNIFAGSPAYKELDMTLQKYVQNLQNKPSFNAAGIEISRTSLFDKVPPLILQRYVQLVSLENAAKLNNITDDPGWPAENSEGDLVSTPTNVQKMYKIMKDLQAINTEYQKFAKVIKPLPAAIDLSNLVAVDKANPVAVIDAPAVAGGDASKPVEQQAVYTALDTKKILDLHQQANFINADDQTVHYDPAKMNAPIDEYVQALAGQFEFVAKKAPEIFPTYALDFIETQSGKANVPTPSTFAQSRQDLTVFDRLIGIFKPIKAATQEFKWYNPQDPRADLENLSMGLRTLNDLYNPAKKVIYAPGKKAIPFIIYDKSTDNPFMAVSMDDYVVALRQKYPHVSDTILKTYVTVFLNDPVNQKKVHSQAIKISTQDILQDPGFPTEADLKNGVDPSLLQKLYATTIALEDLNGKYPEFAANELANQNAGIDIAGHLPDQHNGTELNGVKSDTTSQLLPKVEQRSKHIAIAIPTVDTTPGNYLNILTTIGIKESDLQGISLVGSLWGSNNDAVIQKISGTKIEEYKQAYSYTVNPQSAFIRLSKDILALEAKKDDVSDSESKNMYQKVIDNAKIAAGEMKTAIIKSKIEELMSMSVPSKGVAIDKALEMYIKDQLDAQNINYGLIPGSTIQNKIQTQINQEYKNIYDQVVALLQKVQTEAKKISDDESIKDVDGQLNIIAAQGKIDNANLGNPDYKDIVKRELESQVLIIDVGKGEKLAQIEANAQNTSNKIWSDYLKQLGKQKNPDENVLLKALFTKTLENFKSALIGQQNKEFTDQQNRAWNAFVTSYQGHSLPIDLSIKGAERTYDQKFKTLKLQFTEPQLADVCDTYKLVISNVNNNIEKLQTITTAAHDIADKIIGSYKLNMTTAGWMAQRIEYIQKLQPEFKINTDAETKKFNEQYNTVNFSKHQDIISLPNGMTNQELIRFYQIMNEKFAEQSPSSLAYNSLMSALHSWSDKDTSKASALGNTVVAVGGGLVRVSFFVPIEAFDAMVDYVDTAVLQSIGLDLKAENHKHLKIMIIVTVIIPTLQNIQAIQNDKNLTDKQKQQAESEIIQETTKSVFDVITNYQLGVGTDVLKTGDARTIGTSMIMSKLMQSASPDATGVYDYTQAMANPQHVTNLDKIMKKYSDISSERTVDHQDKNLDASSLNNELSAF